ncbi:CopG family transcriptional regulator [Deinococcus sp.]|uniref:ribbon-helix-helix domain-containing protein n=1 Tax=Deinococcus sp. TaxID=47478 RepID=UPI003CC5AE88
MTHQIELPDDVFELVEQMRRERGVSRADLIRQLVSQTQTGKVTSKRVVVAVRQRTEPVFTAAERLMLKRAREEAARGETVDGRKFFASLFK